MKLTQAQKKRLAFLFGKSDRTAAEETEFKSLQSLAQKEGLTLDDAFKTEFKSAEGEVPAEVKFNADGTPVEDEPTPLGSDDVKKLIGDAVAAALQGKSLTNDDVVSAIIAKIQGANDGTKNVPTADEIKTLVASHLKSINIDADAIASTIAAKLAPTSDAGLPKTAAELEAHVKRVILEQQRQGSIMQHDSGLPGKAYPVEHRLGNLSVGSKQLLNVILMGAPKDAFDDESKRPKHMDEGIAKDLITRASRAGEQGIKSIRDNIRFALNTGKALTTGGSGTGAEFVPSDLSSELQMRLYLQSALAAQMLAGEIDMPTPSYTLPLKTTRTRFYKGSENPGSNPTASEPGTGDIVLTAKKFIGTVLFTYEFDEDSIVPVLGMIQDDLALGAADAFEHCVVNGDVTATHMDSDVHAISNHASKNFKGFRKLALAGSTAFAVSGITWSNIKLLRKKMGKWGVKPSDVFVLTGSLGYNDLVGLDETLTLDKVGPQARILTGEAGFIGGMPIVISEAVREDLNASGVYDGSTTTKGSIFLVHRPSWHVGVRRGFTVEMDRDTRQQTHFLTASFRRDMVPRETVAANMPLVVMGYNYNSGN